MFFGLLKNVVHVVAFVESGILHGRGKGYQLAGKVLLSHYAGVELGVCRRCHVRCKPYHEGCAAGLLQCARLAELVYHRHHVDGLLLEAEGLDGFVYEHVARLVEAFGLEKVAHGGVCVFLYHKCAEYRSLNLDSSRHEPSERVFGHCGSFFERFCSVLETIVGIHQRFFALSIKARVGTKYISTRLFMARFSIPWFGIRGASPPRP